MLVEIITIIGAGIAVVEGVTRIIKNIQEISDHNSKNDLQESINEVQGKMSVVENELNRKSPDEEKLKEYYSRLVDALKQDKNYSSKIKIVPTDYGTWKILRRKSTTLRDPNGEF